MKRWMAAAAALAALGACNQLANMGDPPLPPVQQGAQAPTQLTPQPAVRQGQVTDQVRTQLLAQIGQLLDQTQAHFAAGMTPATGVQDEVRPMQPGADHRWRVSLAANTAYTFIGACDGDCTNIDIELIDTHTGGVVASDTLPDDYPVVNYMPTANGDYLARVILQNCTTAPCYVGVRELTAAPVAGKPA